MARRRHEMGRVFRHCYGCCSNILYTFLCDLLHGYRYIGEYTIYSILCASMEIELKSLVFDRIWEFASVMEARFGLTFKMMALKMRTTLMDWG